ncbi:hypothetical protein BH11ARM2_BH11ARM2_12280 [soil metagenome]
MGFSAGDHFLVILFVGMVAIFGLALLFVRSEVIEREGLVGGLTILTSSMAGAILALPWILSTPALFGVSVLAISGYIIGRIMDRAMGPMDPRSAEMNESTMGVELAD